MEAELVTSSMDESLVEMMQNPQEKHWRSGKINEMEQALYKRYPFTTKSA